MDPETKNLRRFLVSGSNGKNGAMGSFSDQKETETDRQTDSHKESERDIRERDRARDRVSREVKVHVLHVFCR